MNRRNPFRGCIGVLTLLMVVGLIATLVVAVIFTQTQANDPALTATLTSTATRRIKPTQPPVASPRTSIETPSAEVIIIVDTTLPTPIPFEISGTNTPDPTLSELSATPANLPTTPTPTLAARHSGTSTYPLTVTAEVQLAQTNVARYQQGVYATRTAIAIESEAIFATLTADAPTPETGSP